MIDFITNLFFGNYIKNYSKQLFEEVNIKSQNISCDDDIEKTEDDYDTNKLESSFLSDILTTFDENCESYNIHREDIIDKLKQITDELNEQDKLLRDEKERWEKTFDAVPDIIFIVDNDRNIVDINKATLDRLGIESKNQIIGKKCYEVLHKNKKRCNPCICLSKNSVYNDHFIYDVKFDEGNSVLGGIFACSSNAIYNEQNQRIGTVIVKRDVTEVRKIEADLIKREEVLNAITKISKLFYNVDDSLIDNILDILRHTLDLDSVVILKHNKDTVQIDKFSAIDSINESNIININNKLNEEDSKVFISKWCEELRKNTILFTNLDNLTIKEILFLSSFNIQSILTIPIFVREQLWGVLSFCNFTKKIIWGTPEIRLLQTISIMISQHIQNKTLEERIKKSKRGG